MGKIVKYCSACEESFAEKFSFCPNCANELSAFEMKPLEAAGKTSAAEISDDPVLEIPDEEPVKAHENKPAETIFEPVDLNDDPAENQTETSGAFAASEASTAEVFENTPETADVRAASENQTSTKSTETEKASETGKASGSIYAASTASSASDLNAGEAEVVYDDYKTAKSSASVGFGTYETDASAGEDLEDGGYHITVIKEKNVKQRNMLLLGSFVLMTTLALGGVVYSIFDSPLLVGAINDDGNLMAILNVDEVPIEAEEQPEKKDDDEGGGGGGGGKEEENETSKGVLANQTEKPQFPPTARAVRLPNPSLPIERSTEGTIKRPPTNEPYGNPNSLSTLTSDGKGSGGGMGSGRGTGQGSGIGTGEGSGIGSGSGSGRGNGVGDGDGDGSGRNRVSEPPPKVERPSGPTTGIQILSKPRPGYTDAARTNNVQGTVMLTVTFLASGQIGGVSAVKGLPNGLTEKAIAAARQIQFKPAMKNGQPYTVTKRIQYNFTIY